MSRQNNAAVRVRIAPSPTGLPHLGTAYIALFNYSFARKNAGKFILRIEDTDQKRYSAKAERQIIQCLKWLGLNWDEGPDCGGDFGPYRQSERREIYAPYIEQLLASGNAYKCYRTDVELDQLRKQCNRLKHANLALDDDEHSRRETAKQSYVVRLKTPESGVCTFNDLLRGEVRFDFKEVDDQVLLKSDGMPTYHFANVVDDHLMQISHIIRGEEWISSVPKHLLLYQYLGWEKPQFLHTPLLRNADSSKLSKRKNAVSIHYYRDMGYLPQALLNYMALLGYKIGEQELLTLPQLVAQFELKNMNSGAPIFSIDKLNWVNQQYILKMSDSELAQQIITWKYNRETLEQIMPLVRTRLRNFSDYAALTTSLFSGHIVTQVAQYQATEHDDEQLQKILYLSHKVLESTVEWDKSSIYEVLNSLSAHFDIKLKSWLKPIFIAVSGSAVALPIFDSMVFLGRDVSLVRLKDALAVCGDCSKKASKKLDKIVQELLLKQ